MGTPIERAFHHCPQCGSTHPEPGKIPFRCPQCQFAMFFGPVAAVGALVIDQAGRLLLVRRSRDPGKGKWGLPGGFVDRNETIEDALIREVFEETKLRLTEVDLFMTYPNRYEYNGLVSAVIDLFYICHFDARDNITLQQSELDRFVWVESAEDYLDDMAFDSNRRAIAAWMR
jgi:ADP-ribose pyrophosphatase